MHDQLRRERDAVITAMLPNVPFDGWTEACARGAARTAGLEGVDVRTLFPGGAIDMVAHYADLADRRMLIALSERDLPAMRIRDRIAAGIRIRLEQHVNDREAVRRAVAITTMPQHAVVAMRSLYNTIDAIWRVAGDTATDFSFYTKRALLGWVYTSTMLHWLDDDSEDHSETWEFLDRRIDNVMQIPKLRSRLQKAFAVVPNPVRAARAFRRGAVGFQSRR
ncbi:MAG: COQ9 family protein [Alphaproteobacteria bacterium]